MSGNATFNLSDSALVSVAHVDAPEVVPSSYFDEVLADTYERVGAQSGLLESLAGIKERRWWPEGYLFTDAAAAAGEKAIAASGVRVDDIGLLIDTSVCRDRLEPVRPHVKSLQPGLVIACGPDVRDDRTCRTQRRIDPFLGDGTEHVHSDRDGVAWMWR